MRADRLRELADYIETKRHAAGTTSSELAMGEIDLGELPTPTGLDGFNMRTYASRLRTDRNGDCETIGCIAGHAATLWPPADGSPRRSIKTHAEEVLGLTIAQSWALFNPQATEVPAGHAADEITPADAGAACRRLADLGVEAAATDRREIEKLIWTAAA